MRRFKGIPNIPGRRMLHSAKVRRLRRASVVYLADSYEFLSPRLAILRLHLRRRKRTSVIDTNSAESAADVTELDAFYEERRTKKYP